MDVSAALLNTQSPDVALRKQAEEFLNNALQTQMGKFMLTLVQALASEEFATVGRQAAGLYLKNVLDAKDFTLQQQKIQAWMTMDANLRKQIKDGSLGILKSSVPIARHTSAQLVAKLGSIELPLQEWPDLLTELLSNVTSGDEGTMHASLECLGYLCDELGDSSIDQNDTNRILTAIVDGIHVGRPPAIRYAAITALRNSLDYVGENFKSKGERDHLMQVICEATQSTDIKTRVVSFECIATIALLYYEYLADYMAVLCDLTFKAITSDQAEVGLQSLEFWSSMCDVEIELLDEAEYAEIDQREAVVSCQRYVQKVLGSLVPILTEALKKQEEDQDEDSWNLSMAAATCLALVAQTVEDECVGPCMAFITQNIQSNDWRCKESAIMAFGSILDGPTTATISPLVREALTLLMGCMTFDNILVRDTTAWTIGRICELHAECISNQMLPILMDLLIRGLDQEPRVSHNICYAIHNIVRAFEDAQGEAVHMLTPYFTIIFDKLLETSNRPNASESNLRGSAYEALSMLIQVGAPEVNEHIMSRLPIILERLERSIQTFIENSDDHRDDPCGLQALLCGVLIAAIQKLHHTIGPLSDRIMQALLQVFSTRNAAAAEESFMAAGALANAIGKDFQRYMQFFGPILLSGLSNSEAYMVCSVAVGVVGDLCRALEKNILPFCDQIIENLLNILKNPNLNRSVKPPVLSCFGDIALAIEGEFERYLGPSIVMILQAADACTNVPADDEEIAEYMNQLRESILEALTGIVQGLGTEKKANLLLEYTQNVGTFLSCIAADTQTRTDSVTMAAVGLIGDLGQSLGKTVTELGKQEFVQSLVNELEHSSAQGQQLAKWVKGVYAELNVSNN